MINGILISSTKLSKKTLRTQVPNNDFSQLITSPTLIFQPPTIRDS